MKLDIDHDALDLLALGERAANTRRHFDGSKLRQMISALDDDAAKAESMLDDAALELRRAWLQAAHEPGDSTLKSPCEGATPWVAGSGPVHFGYERDLDVSSLEHRAADYVGVMAGWTSELVLCRSGQAALSSVLHVAMDLWGRHRPLHIAHVGSYFETRSLLESWSPLVTKLAEPRQAEDVDLVIAEPVFCDGQFGILKTQSVPKAGRALILDTTMVGPAHDLTPYLSHCSTHPVLIAINSGLKLDQAGLELANVGIVRIFCRLGHELAAADIGSRLRRVRGLTGCGLTLDEMSALSAPWFMDLAHATTYTRGVFHNNALLAAAVGLESPVFAAHCHPSLLDCGTVAPFCALQMRGSPSVDAYRRLTDIVQREAVKRDIVLSRGGSFGFRGHRLELIEPEAGPPFLRIALGWRGGHSMVKLCELFHQLAGYASFRDIARHLA